MAELEINGVSSLKAWLDAILSLDRRINAGAEISVRAALRVFPLLVLTDALNQTYLDEVASLEAHRCLLLAWAVANFPKRRNELSATMGDISMIGFDRSNSNSAKYNPHAMTSYAAKSVAAALSSTKRVAANRTDLLGLVSTLNLAARSLGKRRYGDIWEEFQADARAIGEDGQGSCLKRPLWTQMSIPWLGAQSFLDSNLPIENGWDVWANWYRAICLGEKTWSEPAVMAIAQLPNEVWEQSPVVVNNRIKEILERSISQSEASERQTQSEEDTISTVAIEAQNDVAIVFGGDEDKPIDVLAFVGGNRVSRTQDNRDTHSEVFRFAQELIRAHESTAASPNNGNALAYEDTKHLLESLGETLEDLRPGLLIPRGEALRQLLARQEVRDDFSDVPPFTDRMRDALTKLVRCYNGLVALDAELARRDEVQFGPDASRVLVSPVEGTKIAEDAVERGVATPAVADALRTEAANAPAVPDPANRNSRRFSEGVKNAGRAVLARAQSYWRTTTAIGKVVGGAIGGTYAAAVWTVANEAWFLNTFADSPAMISAIKAILSALKKLPLFG
jgi:hypothetical protein